MSASVYLNSPAARGWPEELLKRAAVAVLDAEGVEGGQLSLTFLPDEPMRALNLRWRGHDWVPDVLSFCLHEPGHAVVGDIYIGVSQAGRQAEEHGVAIEEELLRLVVHGTLHVLGYDHPEAAGEREGSDLFRKQEAFVRMLLAGSSGGVEVSRRGSEQRP